MPAVDFPNSPTINDEFVVGNTIYKWTGSVWEIKSSNLISPVFSNENPIMDSSASSGVSSLASRSDHVHPSDTSKASTSSLTSHTSATVSVHGISDTANLVYTGDSRLIDSRTPTSHASSHASAGTDPITIAQSQVTNLTTDLSAKAPLSSPTFTGTPSAPTADVDTNTTQIATTGFVIGQGYLKTSSASSTYAPIASPTFTGTVSGITSSMVGLGNVDNTSDLNKPVSTLQQTALDGKASLSGATFTGHITLHANPTDALHAATKQYVDAIAEGLHIHASVQAATTSNISDLASPGASIDGVTLTNNMRVLVKNQTTTSQNGIYVYNSSTGALSRALDFDTAAETNGGDFVFVTGGTQNDNTGWVQTETVSSIGSDPILFQQFSGAGTVTAGTNISITGTQVSVVNDPTFSGLITASSGVAFSDGTQTKVGLPSLTSFVPKTSSYTLDTLTLRDSLIEVNSASATTITVPLDSTLNFPVGTGIDILQVGAGQVTIAAAVGVTINSPDGGLKLRTQWSAASLIKRSANTWLLAGDTTT